MNLLSTEALTYDGARITLDKEGGKIIFPNGMEIEGRKNKHSNHIEIHSRELKNELGTTDIAPAVRSTEIIDMPRVSSNTRAQAGPKTKCSRLKHLRLLSKSFEGKIGKSNVTFFLFCPMRS